MRINKKLERKIQYELKRNNRTRVKFSNIASKLDLNRNIFAIQNNEIKTFKYFTFAFFAVSVIIIIISSIFFSNVKKIEIEKNHTLAMLSDAYISTRQELKKNKESARRAEAMNREFEKELVYVLGKGGKPNPDLNKLGNLSPDYQFADGLTFEEKRKNINDDFVVDFDIIEKIDLNEKEYIYLYLNTRNSLDSNEKLLCYKAFLENEENNYEITFLINSSDSKFTIENKVNTNVCNFNLVNDIVIITKMTIKLNDEVIVTKYIEITSNNE